MKRPITYFAIYLHIFHFLISHIFSHLCKITRVFLFFSLYLESKYFHGIMELTIIT